MELEFIPYEEALELEKLGFDYPCFGFYNLRGNYFANETKIYSTSYSCKAPLYQQAFRWFREKYGVSYEICRIGGADFPTMWNCLIHWPDERIIRLDDKRLYEQAELNCLQAFIRKAKNK